MTILVIAVFLFLGEYVRAGPDPTSPIITIGLANITVSQGQRAQLFCEAIGFPKPKVKILKRMRGSPKHIDVDLSKIGTPLETGNAFKVIRETTVDDEGWYYCRAKNKIGVQITRAYITINRGCSAIHCPSHKVCEINTFTNEPVCRCPVLACNDFDAVCGTDCNTYFSKCFLDAQNCEMDKNVTIKHRGFCSIPSPPVVDYWQTNVTVAMGMPIELQCNAKGSPMPTVNWYHQLRDEDPVLVSDHDTLYIPSAQVLDNGLYFCQAKTCGDLIAQSNVFKVKVETPPVLPTCVVAGNGHVRTFDSQSYSFGGQCSYLMARNCHNSDWYVYNRFGGCQVGATCLEAITVYHKNVFFEIGRGWYVNMGHENFVMKENEERTYVEDQLTFRMNGTHLHADLPEIRVIWDGVTTAHVVLQEEHKDTSTCGICGGNYGENSYRSSMLGQDEALKLVVDSRLDYYRQCEPSYLQTYQCSAASRSQATAMCKDIFNCPGFRSCKQVVDMGWYMSTCIQDSCSKEYLSAYPSPCRATAAFNEMCAVAGFDVSECIHKECNVKNVLVGSHCADTLPFRGCGPTL